MRPCHLLGCITSDVALQVVLGTWLEAVDEVDGWWKIKMPKVH